MPPPMTSNAPSQETTNALIEADLVVIHRELRDQREKIIQLEAEKQSAYRYGISVLGLGVVGLGGWIFNYIIGAPNK